MCNSSRPTGSFRCTRPPVARRLSTTMNVSYHEACPALRTPQGWPESLGTGGRFPSEQPAEFIGMRTEETGLRDIHPHKFRHGLAIHLLQQGVPIPVISARLGHASVYVTMSMYMKVTPEIQAEMVKNVTWR